MLAKIKGWDRSVYKGKLHNTLVAIKFVSKVQIVLSLSDIILWKTALLRNNKNLI